MKPFLMTLLLLFLILGCSLNAKNSGPTDLKLKSSLFKEGGSVPQKFTCDGKDISPALQWSGAPNATKTLALIMDDPDAPAGTWVHWVIYNIPGNQKKLPEGIPTKEKLSNGTRQASNDFRKAGYGGPCPPEGKSHHYFFKLYALDTMLDLPSMASKSQLEASMESHILGQTQLMGTYQRKK